MPGNAKIIDERVKDEILHYSTVELIQKLFPELNTRGRSIMRSPFRDDHDASFSCFIDRHGFPRWKDHGTGESGDNIDLYRKLFPEQGYVESIDRLSLLILGRSALQDFVPGRDVPFYNRRRVIRTPKPEVEQEPVLKVISDTGCSPADTPDFLVNYWRGRGVSDQTAMQYLHSVVFENSRLRGRTVIDSTSGLPVVGRDGEPIRDDGRTEALGLLNDIGGFSLRSPETAYRKSFKGCNTSFISTIFADGSVPSTPVRLVGNGDGFVSYFRYNALTHYLAINDTQGFAGVQPYAVRFAVPFLDGWTGRFLSGRDLRCATAVLGSLNGPVNTVATVVEGMFDALSVVELNRMRSGVSVPGTDLIVLNSVSNLSWAVPFLAMHNEVRSYLDNDLKSSAGQKTFAKMVSDVEGYSYRTGSACSVRSYSSSIFPYKDINDYLKHCRGFDVQVEAQQKSSVGIKPIAPAVRPQVTHHKAKQVKF